MLPTPSVASNKPDKKSLSLFFPGISSSDPQPDATSPSSGVVAASSPVPTTPVDAKATQRNQMIRDGILLFVTLALAVVFVVLGPSGEFIAGKAFTITTTNEVTYVYYNWTVQLPSSIRTLNMQAYNNRLAGNILFTPAPATDSHYTINIETTVNGRPLMSFDHWIMYEQQQCGFTIHVSDLLTNTYSIDYVNVIVYIPASHIYNQLIWNTYPNVTSEVTLPSRKWNVAFGNLTDANIQFSKIKVVTDGGTISSKGLSAGEGYFQTQGGPITGEYTVPPTKLVLNTSGGGSPDG